MQPNYLEMFGWLCVMAGVGILLWTVFTAFNTPLGAKDDEYYEE